MSVINIEIDSTQFDELKRKIEKANALFLELKELIEEINKMNVEIILKTQ